MEYWSEMTARHRRERLELVQSLAPSHCIKDAAKILNVPEPNLRRYAHYYNVEFQYTRSHKRDVVVSNMKDIDMTLNPFAGAPRQGESETEFGLRMLRHERRDAKTTTRRGTFYPDMMTKRTTLRQPLPCDARNQTKKLNA